MIRVLGKLNSQDEYQANFHSTINKFPYPTGTESAPAMQTCRRWLVSLQQQDAYP